MIDDEPVALTVPSHSSMSWEALSSKAPTLTQLAPPPLTELTVMLADETLTDRTSASPTVFGLTESEETPLPSASAREPTAEMTGAAPLACTAATTLKVPERTSALRARRPKRRPLIRRKFRTGALLKLGSPSSQLTLRRHRLLGVPSVGDANEG